MRNFIRLAIVPPTICLWVALASADPILLTAGQISNTRIDSSVTVPGPGPLIVDLQLPNHPSWFGIMNPGELVNFTAGISTPFTAGVLQLNGTEHVATPAAPILFDYQLRTPTFPLVFGTGTPFAIEGAFANQFGRVHVAGGGTISITEEALTFRFQPNPPDVPAPVPEPATWLLVCSGMGVLLNRKRQQASTRNASAVARHRPAPPAT